MRLIRAIIISSLAIPVLIFFLFLIAGLVFMVANLEHTGEYSNGWLGMVYAGTTYGYLAVLISSIPTIALGLPFSFLAKKYDLLRKQVILLGAFLLGGVYLAMAGVLLLKSYSTQAFMWLFVAGAMGGLINGAVFYKYIKPNTYEPPSCQ